MRGRDPARLLGASLSVCGDAGPGFDIYVHVKAPCGRALALRGRHVLDVVDGLKEFGGNYSLQASQRLVARGFHAQLFSSEHEVQAYCAAPHCRAAPHFFNLQHCISWGRRTGWASERLQSRPLRLGLVGYQRGFAGLPASRYWPAFSLPSELAAEGAKIVHEGADTCAFFAGVDVAIAWPRKTIDHRDKPAERFTNPIVLGIPTIGSPYFHSHAAFASAQNFTCSSERCVVRTIARLRSGELDAAFRQLQREVWAEVSPTHAKDELLDFFDDLS